MSTAKGPGWPRVLSRRKYRAKQPYRSHSKKPWEPVASVPEGMRWKPEGARSTRAVRMLSTPGSQYRLIRDLKTGEVTYFKLAGTDAPATPKEQIDAEPKKKGQVRYRVGAFCWFIDEDSRWYCVEVIARAGGNRETFGEHQRITIRPTTGWDAERVKEWPYGEALEFPSKPDNRLFSRLRPLKARQT